MTYLLFGAGDYYERYKKWFDKKTVLALLDNSSKKQNRLIDGIKVLSPEDGVKLQFDIVVILSFHVKAMKRQLLELGVPEEKIYHFYDLHRLFYKKEHKKPILYYGISEEIATSNEYQKRRILLLSQDMLLGGASIALFHAAKVLAENKYNVVFASMIDGPLREKLLSENIPVIIDVNLQLRTMRETEWLAGFSLIFCNTINFHIFLLKRNNNVPIIWWLHDSAFFYAGVSRDVLQSLDRTNMKIYSVSSIPENAIKQYISDIETERLLFGVEDIVECADRKGQIQKDKICFTVIGDIEERKGQDILIRSVRRISEIERKNIVIFLVGRSVSMMAQQLKMDIKELPEIIMTGAVDRKGIDEILNKTDILICPSREDAMSMVAVEAMAHQVPCIVSHVTGIAEYIQNGIDGLIFRSEDTKELAEKIKWCIENREELPGMGVRSRKIYDTYFSMDVFEKNLLDIVDDILLQK
ncbi:hypothetical protein C818_02132 [Lachnospiraceae bacterium MD308]|nr:hypothetical protein C818_02132 [Lachnospiraceae bacterium MD308]